MRDEARSESNSIPTTNCGPKEGSAVGGGEEQTARGASGTPISRPQRPRLPLTDDRSWDVQDVAYFLHVSESTVRNLERDRQLPALPRIGTRVTFDPKVVRAFRDGWRPSPAGRASVGAPKISSHPAPDRQGR